MKKEELWTDGAAGEEVAGKPSFRDNFPCPYFDDGRQASIECAVAGRAVVNRFDAFLSAGYRRLGDILYRNVCEGCRSCRSIRLRPSVFRPGRSQKRTAKKNADVHVEIPSFPSLTREKIRLYKEYLLKKHKEEEKSCSCEALLAGLHYGYPGVIEMDYYLDGRLVGVGIVDEGRSSLSSNYFYYDPACLDRRLGVFSILQEIALALFMKKRFYYLGFHIEEISRMSYKKFFRPNQVLENSRWREFVV
ncbi:MAG: arginyltransferase [Candidatus Sulfobium sp.]